MKNFVMFAVIAGMLLLSAFSQSQTVTAVSDKPKLTIPKHAKEIASGVFHLGQAKDKDGKTVEGIMIIDYKKGNAKSSGVGGGKGGTICYSLLASGAKWKTQEPWIINTSNGDSLDSAFLLSNTTANIQKWESAGAGNVFGDGTQTSDVLIADEITPDGTNEVYFGSIDDPGAIAVTIVWGTFSGPVKQRHLIEWDQVFDEVDFDWSSTAESGKMDFENISTHEIGHAFGMGHPSGSCIEETMYAYASTGETKKRDLNSGDIAGINALY